MGANCSADKRLGANDPQSISPPPSQPNLVSYEMQWKQKHQCTLAGDDEDSMLSDKNEIDESTPNVQMVIYQSSPDDDNTPVALLSEGVAGMELSARLCAAAAMGELEKLRSLLDAKANPLQPDYSGRTPLHLAAGRGFFEGAKLLLKEGADAYARDAHGFTPIDEAMREVEPEEMLRLLTDSVPQKDRSNKISEKKIEIAELEAQRESLKTTLAEQQMTIKASEIQLGRCLSQTIKSQVHIATWRGTKVVVKMVKDIKDQQDKSTQPEDSIPARSMKELLHEIEIFSTMRHPDLVLFLGANLDSKPLILTEFMEEGDVESYMSAQTQKIGRVYRPPQALALQWASSVARALSFLHGCSHPIIHRDLKPKNLVLNQRLELKVTDFGIAKVMPRQSATYKSGWHMPAPLMSGGVGTYRYMAPEVVRYEQYTDRIDVYSFGLILYLMFSGRQPFYHFCKDPELILKAYLRGQEPRPELNNTIGSPEIRNLMKEAWHADAAKRPSAQECVERLAALEKESSKAAAFKAIAWARGITA
jgi:tRNA A-37 threonylcarbamoyl transferase component Bud32